MCQSFGIFHYLILAAHHISLYNEYPFSFYNLWAHAGRCFPIAYSEQCSDAAVIHFLQTFSPLQDQKIRRNIFSYYLVVYCLMPYCSNLYFFLLFPALCLRTAADWCYIWIFLLVMQDNFHFRDQSSPLFRYCSHNIFLLSNLQCVRFKSYLSVQLWL